MKYHENRSIALKLCARNSHAKYKLALGDFSQFSFKTERQNGQLPINRSDLQFASGSVNILITILTLLPVKVDICCKHVYNAFDFLPCVCPATFLVKRWLLRHNSQTVPS